MEKDLIKAVKNLLAQRVSFYERHKLPDETIRVLQNDTEYSDAWDAVQSEMDKHEESLMKSKSDA